MESSEFGKGDLRVNNNLFEKILVLIDDTVHLDRMAKARVLEKFLSQEMGMQGETKYLDFQDLMLIQSRASGILTQEPIHSELSTEAQLRGPEYMRLACIVQATVEFLNSKGFMMCGVGFRGNHKKKGDQVTFCRHARTAKFDIASAVCPDCGKHVHPAIWNLSAFKK